MSAKAVNQDTPRQIAESEDSDGELLGDTLVGEEGLPSNPILPLTNPSETIPNLASESAIPGALRPGFLKQGSIFGRYLILDWLGAGGMGEVYKAYDNLLARRVALKLLGIPRQAGPHELIGQKRLVREAKALAQLSHPNIIAVYDVGMQAECVYLAMELVEGPTLKQWLAEKRRSVREVLEVMSAAGRGLEAAHRVGIIHRDFKPSNVILGKDGRVRVLDFGLARATEPDADLPATAESMVPDSTTTESTGSFENTLSQRLLTEPITGSGKTIGTPLYMSPEQHMRLRLDPRSDQFSFCVVLFEALYGQRPFQARSRKGLKRAIILGRISPSPNEGQVPSWLRKLVARGLRPQSTERFANMEELLRNLKPNPVRARPAIAVVALALVIALATYEVALNLRTNPSSVCRSETPTLDGVWDEGERLAVREAFLATNLPFSGFSWMEVETILTGYAHAWQAAMQDACRHPDHPPSEAKLACLANARTELHSLVGAFKQPDRETLRRAVKAASDLSPIAKCTTGDPPGQVPNPTAAKATAGADRARLQQLRNELVQIKILSETGRLQAALQRTEALVNQADPPAAQDPVGKLLLAELRLRLGLLQSEAGQYPQAEESLLQSSWTARGAGADEIEARALLELAKVQGIKQTRTKDGYRSLGQARAVLTFLGGHTDLLRQAVLVEAGLARSESKFAQAYPLLEAALVHTETELGADSLDTLEILGSLGVVAQRLGKLDRAVEVNQRALGLIEKRMGTEHPEVANTLTSLATSFALVENFEKALECADRARALKEKLLGPLHPELAPILNNLGSTLFEMGRLERAWVAFSQALSIDESSLGPEHPRVANTLSNLGMVYLRLHQPEKALEVFQRALIVRQKGLGPEHVSVASSLADVADALLSLKRLEPALAQAQRAVEICAQQNCPTETIAQTEFELGKALLESGRDRERGLERVRSVRDKLRPETSPRSFQNQVETWLKEHT